MNFIYLRLGMLYVASLLSSFPVIFVSDTLLSVRKYRRYRPDFFAIRPTMPTYSHGQGRRGAPVQLGSGPMREGAAGLPACRSRRRSLPNLGPAT